MTVLISASFQRAPISNPQSQSLVPHMSIQIHTLEPIGPGQLIRHHSHDLPYTLSINGLEPD
jgi:hypothetical protein